jgi:phage shock protein A
LKQTSKKLEEKDKKVDELEQLLSDAKISLESTRQHVAHLEKNVTTWEQERAYLKKEAENAKKDASSGICDFLCCSQQLVGKEAAALRESLEEEIKRLKEAGEERKQKLVDLVNHLAYAW